MIKLQQTKASKVVIKEIATQMLRIKSPLSLIFFLQQIYLHKLAIIAKTRTKNAKQAKAIQGITALKMSVP